MMLKRKTRQIGLVVSLMLGTALSGHAAYGQDAAWEGLINAGRNALQQQKFLEAERHFEAALEAAEQFPSGDARRGKSYNNLAAVYYAQEDYSRAGPLMRRALGQLKEALGPENTEVAQTMKNLAALYYLQGDRGEAESLLQQSLAILESVHGPNHAFVATVLGNLAGLYQAENRYQDAEPLLTRSLEIWESLLGPEHPDVVRSRSLLAAIQDTAGEERPLAAVASNDLSRPTQLAAAAANQVINPVGVPGGALAAGINQATGALEPLANEVGVRADEPPARQERPPLPVLKPLLDNQVAALDVDAAAASPEKSEASGSSLELARLENGTALADEAVQETAVAILNDAASADDVSFSVHLSTLWSIEEAELYWKAIQTALPDVLQGKRMEIVETAALAGTDPFYRVLTFPFTSDPEAQAACAEIEAKLSTHDCNVVIREKVVETAGG